MHLGSSAALLSFCWRKVVAADVRASRDANRHVARKRRRRVLHGLRCLFIERVLWVWCLAGREQGWAGVLRRRGDGLNTGLGWHPTHPTPVVSTHQK